MSNLTTITISLIFWLSPVALTIHLAITRNKSNSYKTKIAYIYSSFWVIALIYYLRLFLE